MMTSPTVVKYSSNNSGGSWWLSDNDWFALEKAGWVIDWVKDKNNKLLASGRWLGALATTAYREGLFLDDAIDEWEEITGQSAYAKGCPCCGLPHRFNEEQI